jgi:hypothetical protein
LKKDSAKQTICATNLVNHIPSESRSKKRFESSLDSVTKIPASSEQGQISLNEWCYWPDPLSQTVHVTLTSMQLTNIDTGHRHLVNSSGNAMHGTYELKQMAIMLWRRWQKT